MSWSEVRVVCLEAARLKPHERAKLDAAIAGDLDALSRKGADDVLDRLYQTLDQLRPVETERTEQRQFEAQWVPLYRGCAWTTCPAPW